jgi:hypothetical protein
MPFNADLNPKKSGMDFLELMKMQDYLGRKTVKPMDKTATPAADAILAKSNDMVKSSANDVGTQFRFNNSQK